MPTSVIASSTYLVIDESNKIQLENTYRPSEWMFENIDEPLMHSIIDSFEKYSDVFRLTRNELLKERLNVVLKSQNEEGEEFFDTIDILVNRKQELEESKICPQCNLKAPMTVKN